MTRSKTGSHLRRLILPLVGASLLFTLPIAMASATTAAKPFQGKSITYLYFTNGPDLNATKALITKFDNTTGATVNLQLVPYANLNQILQADVSAGRAPAVVQTTSPSTFGSDLVNLGKALGPSWVKSLSHSLLGEAIYKGQIVALPNQLTVDGPIVNVTMFNKAHVPVPSVNSHWSWQQMVAAANKVQAANGTEFAIAMDHSAGRTSNVFCEWGYYLFGNNGMSSGNAGDALAAMKYVANLFDTGVMSKDFWIAAGTNYAAGDTEFLAKQAPVLLSGSWEIASFATSVPFKWTVVPSPCEAVCGAESGGNYMEAFKNSNDPALAEAFIRFMSEPANQAYMSVISDTIPSAAADAKPGTIQYPAAVRSDMNAFNNQAPLMPAGCNLSEANPGFDAAGLVLEQELTKVMAGQATPQAAVSATLQAARKNNGA